jgi:hypothetical protein
MPVLGTTVRSEPDIQISRYPDIRHYRRIAGVNPDSEVIVFRVYPVILSL